MLVHIYIPRLDVMFKRGPVPEQRGSIAPIRMHWDRFVRHLARLWSTSGHSVKIIEHPLWQITPELVEYDSKSADLIYIPHKSVDNWLISDNMQYKIRYYMQMVIPELFSIDPIGWCASASYWPIPPKRFEDDETERNNILAVLKSRINSNTSKFDQPTRVFPNTIKNYIFFPCQLPHDETIQYHSKVSVEDALEMTLKWAAQNNKQVLIKGHPINPSSMEPLRVIAAKYPHMWTDDYSIHQLIRNARMTVTVNSGVGFETLLHGKRVAIFGDADYEAVAAKIRRESYMHDFAFAQCEISSFELSAYDRFLVNWYHTHYDVSNPQTFEKILHKELLK